MYEKHDVTTSAGIKMPPLIYGTAWKGERTADLVYEAIMCGFRGIDTACQPKHYNEAGVGDALQRLFDEGFRRDALFIQTKFTPLEGQDPRRIPYDPESSLREQVLRSFEVSKQNLRCDTIDSLVLHSPLFPYQRLIDVWHAMEMLAQNGEVRQLGISNCYDLPWLQRLYGDAKVKPAVVQNRFYADTGFDIELRSWCREQGIIYQSFWTLTANPYLLAHPVMREIAGEYDLTTAQLLFAYLHQLDVIPLTGTTSPGHMHEDLQSFDTLLEDDAIHRISRLLEAA